MERTIADLYKTLEIAETEWPEYTGNPYEFAKGIRPCVSLDYVQVLLSDSTVALTQSDLLKY